MRFAVPLIVLLSVAAATTVQAQIPGIGSLGGASKGGASSMMGMGGMAGGLAPDVSSMGAGNAAGVIGYCVKNKFLGEGSGVGSVMDRLQGKQAPQQPGFDAGQAGQLVLGGGKGLSMDSLPGPMKSKVCDMVLTHAKSLI